MKKSIFYKMSFLLAPLATIPAIVSCASGEEEAKDPNNQMLNSSGLPKSSTNQVRIATYNISFATDGDNSDNGGADYYQRWEKYMSYTREQQDNYIKDWLKNEPTSKKPKDSKANVDTNEHLIAERIIQIRNIAAQIQFNRPDVVLLNEFNNNGVGNSNIMQKFQENYLNYPQFYDGTGGKHETEPITYPHIREYATNTGLLAVNKDNKPLDFDNDGYTAKQAKEDLEGVDLKGNPIKIYKGMVYSERGVNQELNKPIYVYEPDDTFGFGYFHGHYAFGVMSMYEFDTTKERTFQKFKLKHMPNSEQYRTKVDSRINDPNVKEKVKYDANDVNEIPLKEGDYWLSDDEWDNFRMSSKNHVDLPIKVNGETIHLLMSHPTPAAFDKCSPQNILRNRAEVEFWKHYINNEQSLYDDNGNWGGLEKNSKFVILGDLNADNYYGSDDDKNGNTHKPEDYNSSIGIKNLTSDILINQSTINFDSIHAPKSAASKELQNSKEHPHPELRTAVFGTRPDWVIGSANIEIVKSGIYWDNQWQATYNLFIDPRLGNDGNSKQVSSDHRLVWIDIKI